MNAKFPSAPPLPFALQTHVLYSHLAAAGNPVLTKTLRILAKLESPKESAKKLPTKSFTKSNTARSA